MCNTVKPSKDSVIAMIIYTLYSAVVAIVAWWVSGIFTDGQPSPVRFFAAGLTFAIALIGLCGCAIAGRSAQG